MRQPIITAQILNSNAVALYDAAGIRRSEVTIPGGGVREAIVSGPLLTLHSSRGRMYVYDLTTGEARLRYYR